LLFFLAYNNPDLNQYTIIIIIDKSVNTYILYNIRLLFKLDN
jgi:hypothetical protein